MQTGTSAKQNYCGLALDCKCVILRPLSFSLQLLDLFCGAQKTFVGVSGRILEASAAKAQLTAFTNSIAALWLARYAGMDPYGSPYII